MITTNQAATGPRRALAAVGLATLAACTLSAPAARAQALSVLPVNIQMAPGQGATTMTVTNHGDTETSIQIRAYAWGQPEGEDLLTGSDAVLVSPPLATIPAHGSQVVRIVLRQRPEGREATYRILMDQIPPPAEPGQVRVVLRISIPIFAQPATRAVAHVRFTIERDHQQAYLVAANDGGHHEAIRDVVLSTSDGHQFKTVPSIPYVLGGATRRWPLATKDFDPGSTQSLLLTAHEDSGLIQQQVQVVGAP